LRPVIGITCRSSIRDGANSEYVIARPYISAIEESGGLPIILPPITEFRPGGAWSLTSICQGLILSGGGDPDPVFFNEEPHAKLGRVDRERDEWEIFLCRAARVEGIPILGICRGIQVINIALGGNLYQDIAQYLPNTLDHMQNTPPENRWHQVIIEKESRLFRVLNTERIWCNSLHHQAVKTVAPQLKVVARAEDGVIEAVEYTGSEFILGVQWHPERLRESSTERIFSEFVACSLRLAGRTNYAPNKAAISE